jgi:hypothetical protein
MGFRRTSPRGIEVWSGSPRPERLQPLDPERTICWASPTRKSVRNGVWVLLLLGSLSFCSGSPDVKDRNWHTGLDEFFKRVDIDGDGQVGPTEARRYIGANLGATGEAEISAALTQMTDNLDSSDAGNTISEAEVEAHLRKLMQVQTLASFSWCTSEGTMCRACPCMIWCPR